MASDRRILYRTRIVRLFAYGFLSVVLVLYLVQVGLSETRVKIDSELRKNSIDFTNRGDVK